MTTGIKLLILCGILFLLILDRCSSINISTSTIFRNPKHKNYPNIEEGVKSEKFEIVKISSDPYSTISYDSINNCFLVHLETKMIKIDHTGKIMADVDLGNFNVSATSHYAYNDSSIIDFSEEDIKAEKFKVIVNADYSLTLDEWEIVFDTYYSRSETVLFESFNTDGIGQGQFYFKMDGIWILLYANRDIDVNTARDSDNNVIFNLEGMNFLTIEDYPEKMNQMILLKDETTKTYSNRGYTTDSELSPNYMAVFKDKYTYPGYSKKTLSFHKERVDETFYYLNIPSYLGGTAYYRLKKDNETFNFKAYAAKFVFSFKVNENFCWFHLPEKLNNKSEVSFLNFRYPTSVDENNKNIGLYIVRRKFSKEIQ